MTNTTPRLIAAMLTIAAAIGCSSSAAPAADAGAADNGTPTPPPPPPPPPNDGGEPLPGDAAAFPAPTATLIGADELALIPNLPKDENGNVILLEVGGTQLKLGPPRMDAIGAAARCMDRFTTCILYNKDFDACAAGLPACATDRPWEEAEACCASACVTAYQQERTLGATPIEATMAVFASDHECFPGRQELIRQAGGEPYLAPRRAP